MKHKDNATTRNTGQMDVYNSNEDIWQANYGKKLQITIRNNFF